MHDESTSSGLRCFVHFRHFSIVGSDLSLGHLPLSAFISLFYSLTLLLSFLFWCVVISISSLAVVDDDRAAIDRNCADQYQLNLETLGFCPAPIHSHSDPFWLETRGNCRMFFGDHILLVYSLVLPDLLAGASSFLVHSDPMALSLIT